MSAGAASRPTIPSPKTTGRRSTRYVSEMMASLDVARAVFLGTSMGAIITMALAAARSRAIAAAILNDAGPEIAPAGVTRILGYVGQPVQIRNWDDAADYVERTNGTAFPQYGEEEWQKFARRTFRDDHGVPKLDYDPAITMNLARPPGKPALWIAGLLFRRLARKRPTLLIRGELSDVISPTIAERMQRKAPGPSGSTCQASAMRRC